MSNKLERIKTEFDNLIKIYQKTLQLDALKKIKDIVLKYKNNNIDLCKIIKEHFTTDDTKYKIKLFDIVDFLFKSDVKDLYINQLQEYLHENFKECFTIGDFNERVLLFKIFYTWKYIIPNDLYESIKTDEKLDDFKKFFMQIFPGKIKELDDYNNKMRKRFIDENKNITYNNFEKNEFIPEKNKRNKLLGKKKKSTHTEAEDENIINKKMILEYPINNNSNINPENSINNQNKNFNLFFRENISPNEIKLFYFLFNSKIKLSKNIPLFSSISKFYKESLFKKIYSDNFSQFKSIKENEDIYQEIRKRMKTKLFQETKKNSCSICGFRTLFYNDLVRHLDIHFNFNLLEMKGKNLFRKEACNKYNWIYEKGENLIDINSKNEGTLEKFIFYRNMMNNNLIKINNNQMEDNEEYMFPINDDNTMVCYYCGDDFKKIFSTKYNYWFYNEVVFVINDKRKCLAHQVCFEELSKKIK